MSLRLLLYLLFAGSLVLVGFAGGQEANDLWIDVETDKGDDATYYHDEPIFISCITGEDAYVVIFNIDTDGKLHLLYPETPEESGFMPGNTTYQIPEENDDYSLKVTAHHGEEFICAIASTAPLRIPSIFGEGAQYSVDGDPGEIMRDIAEDMLEGTEATYTVDMSHFYVGDEEEFPCFPPLPPFPLPPWTGCLQVVSKPENAKVYLNGKYCGTTPTVIAGIPPGCHTLVVKKSCYHRFCEEVCIGEGEREQVKVRLKWKLF